MTSLAALFSCALFFIALLFALFQVKRWGRYWPVAYIFSAVFLVIPLQNWLIIEFVRGYVSDLSMATVMICALYLWNIVRPNSVRIQVSFKWLMLVIAIILYPMSMGVTQFDPFTMGYASNEGYVHLITGFTLVGLLAWVMGYQHIAMLVLLALLANGFQIYESQNFWTYLIDPIAVMVCLFALVFNLGVVLFNRFKMADVRNAKSIA